MSPDASFASNNNNNSASSAPSSNSNVDPTSARRPVEPIQVTSPNLTYSEEELLAKYTFHSSAVKKTVDGQGQVKYEVKPVEKELEFKTLRKVPKTG
jgi:myo-inositol-1-phosphate synthase